MNHKYKAFSLIEIVIVIAIISLTSYLVLFSYNLKQSHKEKIELERFLIDIKNTKYSSINNKEKSSFKIVSGNKYSYIQNGSANLVSLDNIIINITKTNIDEVSFTKNGIPNFESPGTIYLDCEINGTFIVTITPVTGNINIRND